MMIKNRKWFVAVSMAAIMAANGVVMAAVSDDKQDATAKKPHAAAEKGMRHKGMHKMENSELLKLLKIDADTFRSEMKAGKSMLTIAKDHGVSEQKLKDFMIKQMTQRIDAGVKAGKLTAEQAEKMKAGMEQRVTKMIKGEGMQRGHGFAHRKADNSALLKLLNIDQATLRSEMKAGKSLAAIAKERGVSEQDLKATLLAQMQQRIDKGVADGKISADKAAEMKAKMQQRVDDMINGKMPMHKR